MRKLLLAIGFAAALSGQALAADNYGATPGVGLTFAAKDNGSSVLFSRFIGCDNTTPAQCWAVDASGRMTVNIAAGSTIAATQSGTWTVTGAGGTFPVTGTFWQATQPVSVASGGIASGAYSAGSFAAGALVAGALVDGADITEGTKADSAYAGSGSASVVSLLKGIYAGITGSIPAGTNAIGSITNTSFGATGSTSNASSGVATGSTNLAGVAYNYGFNGTTWDQLQVDGSKNLKVTNTTATPAGTNLMGKVGIDQTTPGTTNGVQLPTTTNGGAATVKGGVAVVNGGSFYQAVAASQTATVLQSSTGATGDYLSHCVLYPTSTSPGVVTVFDNTNAAASSAILFPGGASSLSNLAPISIPVGSYSTGGPWKVTTGASISVVCYGKFS